MSLFGFTFISKKRLSYLESQAARFETFQSYHYWFSGFPKFYEILHKFVCHEIHQGNIWEVRHAFGKSLGLDDWGQKIEESK